ncbi:MAG: formylglycine-generating enzyme family protein, partial [Gammaproteobacteria bacterium]|nr:formylglycine-generating enzyme family protein [Gammaproteobacteria bacterium]
APTPRVKAAPAGMVTVPAAAAYDFRVTGLQIEGENRPGLDVQYPWETVARREHVHRMAIARFHIDVHPVTNEAFARFVQATGYRPADDHHFLAHWQGGQPAPHDLKRPVVWVGVEDARAYCRWAGKRLPHEWEWQYAAQGTDGRRYPWGSDWRDDLVPPAHTARSLPVLAEVGRYPQASSPFGVQELVGHLWQWTDEFEDDRTRAAIVRGGSPYQPQGASWYFPNTRRLDQHGKLLLMAPSKDRSGLIGFRCVADAE